MNEKNIIDILKEVKDEKVTINDAVEVLKNLPFKEMGFAKIDNHRGMRVGYPEVIYCENKTIEQVKDIIQYMLSTQSNILATRATEAMYIEVKKICDHAKYNNLARTITIEQTPSEKTDSYIAIVAAGTSDLPVVEEAKETAMILGNKVEVIVDVGVAGIHRLFASLDAIRGAKVVIVVAGMEGALASVVGGLVDKPVIAVPTSVGYGANFNGLSALLCMLNSCASGVSVVNIDNGFGAAYTASMINKL